jgi:hypothetical protein
LEEDFAKHRSRRDTKKRKVDAVPLFFVFAIFAIAVFFVAILFFETENNLQHL